MTKDRISTPNPAGKTADTPPRSRARIMGVELPPPHDPRDPNNNRGRRLIDGRAAPVDAANPTPSPKPSPHDTHRELPAVRLRDLGMLAPRELAGELSAIVGVIESTCYRTGPACDCGMLRDRRREYHDPSCACRALEPAGVEQIETLLTELAGVVAVLRKAITIEPDSACPRELLSRYYVTWGSTVLAESPLSAAHVAEGILAGHDSLSRPRLHVVDQLDRVHEVDLATGEILSREVQS